MIYIISASSDEASTYASTANLSDGSWLYVTSVNIILGVPADGNEFRFIGFWFTRPDREVLYETVQAILHPEDVLPSDMSSDNIV